MKKVLKTILITLLILTIVSFGVFAYYDGFKSIEITTKEYPAETIVYEEVTGSYSKTPEVTDKIYYWLLDNEKVETTSGFGIFYDNPQQVDESKLRSDVGCILNTPLDSIQLASVQTKYKIKTLPKQKYVVAEFPFKGIISIMIGMMKVYPAITDYCKKNNIEMKDGMMEVYDMKNMKTYYRIPLPQ